MKAKSKTTKTLQFVSGIFAVYFFALILIAFILGNLSFSNQNDNLLLLLILIFLIGVALSWWSTKMAGIVLMFFNLTAFSSLFFHMKDDGGMFTGVPVMVIGAFFLLEWYKTSKATVPSKQQQWRFMLRVLLINYLVIYGIVVISELVSGNGIDYFSLPYNIFPLLLLIFLVGALLSWKKELLAGFIFLFWCLVFMLGAIAYPEILTGDPWIIFIIPILIQGIFYIKNHYKFRAT